MKYLVVSFILFFCTLQTFGQQEYFVYLQTDNNQAFYIRVSNNVFSSTSSGYLILSKLSDSTSSVTIGFPKNVFPEQQFNIPINHKDAGYLVKNFGDKGWGLFNLQTLAVIMNSNPPPEKKSPEITTTKKNDAFSLLLANAVNDTSVLYTVNRPPKPAPPPVIIAEKKTDTAAALVIKDAPVHDTAALVKTIPEKKDSNLVTKNNTKPPADSNKKDLPVHDTAALVKTIPEKKDSNLVTKKNTTPPADNNKKDVPVKDTAALVKNLPERKDSSLVTKNNRKPVTDTTTIAKSIAPPASDKDSAKSVTAKIKQFFSRKNVSKPRKDTIIIAGNNTNPTTAVAKNERKDTIIMMTGKVPDSKPVVKNTPPQKVNKPLADKKKDSLQIVKNDKAVKKPEEKTIVPAINPLASAGQNNIAKGDTLANKATSKKDTITALVKNNKAAKHDTLINNTASKKDTAAVLVKNEAPKTADKDSAITAPVKRQRPIVNRAAEFLTDTSYIAVFIDESKDKFDTIRISIPFNEEAAFAKQEKAVVKDTKLPDTNTGKTTKDSLPSVVKKDTAADKAITVAVNQPPVTPVKKDSAPAIVQQAPAPVVKQTDTVALTDSAKTTTKQVPTSSANPDCKETASDSDIDKLRIKMLLVNADEDRLALAKKVYRLKCFSVKQVRALSELFKNDEGKYQWLDAVYPFVADSGNFSSLADILKDNYYLNRFRAMLRN